MKILENHPDLSITLELLCSHYVVDFCKLLGDSCNKIRSIMQLLKRSSLCFDADLLNWHVGQLRGRSGHQVGPV